jgi:hypothetical protein
MGPTEPGDDDTVRILPMLRRKRVAWPLALAAAAGIVLAGSAWVWLPRSHPSAPPRTATAPTYSPVFTAPPFHIELATEDEISAHVATSLTVFRFADNPRILVLDFASLHEQGKMLNRVAAFVEKAGMPRDRVLTDGELDAAIHTSGDTAETFYLGHDYAASALARFFEQADSQEIALSPQEEKLRALLRDEGWLTADVMAGLISLSAVGSDPRITASARGAILRHELSHGEFFSNPAYARYVHDFWLTYLTEQERAGVRAFLAREEYDVGEEVLMYNEMQAYLMFTRDPAFFTPEQAGLAQLRLAELQARFLAGMQTGWLRTVLADYETTASVQ